MSGSLTEQRDRNTEQGLGVIDAGDVAGIPAGEVAHDPFVHGDHGEAEHQWDGETQPLLEHGMRDVKVETEAGAAACGSDGVGKEWAEDASDQCAIGKAVNTDPSGKKDPAGDDADVVNERSKSRNQEFALGELDRADHSADIEKELCRKQDAREVDTES